MPELAHIEIVVFLQSVDLFSYCKAEEVLRIAGIAKEKSFAQDERIYAADDPADWIYCIVRGSVGLTSPQEGERSVGPLKTFGVSEILSGRLREATATAETDTLLLAFEAEDFFDLLANNIEIVRAIFRHLVPHLRSLPESAAAP